MLARSNQMSSLVIGCSLENIVQLPNSIRAIMLEGISGVMYGICGDMEIRQIWHQGPSSEAMNSIMDGVATLKPCAIGGHRVVVCFLCSSTTEVAWM